MSHLNRISLLKRGIYLEYLTLGWNVVGTVVVLVAAVSAGSVALAGFGLDSLLEIFASGVVVWQLNGIDQDREQRALRLIGIAFVILGVYILVQTGYIILSAGRPQQSVLGIIWTGATLVAMLSLAWGKGRVGRRLENPVLVTESHVTVIDGYLAGSVLVGLLLNTLLGWWWADPLAGLVIVFYAFREAIEIWQEEV